MKQYRKGSIKPNNLMAKILLLLICSLFLCVNPSGQNQAQASGTDVTSKVVFLGNPFHKGPYARNVWDMQVFNNRVYLAHGDLVSDAGPIPIIYYDPQTGKFVTELVADDEQLDNFKIYDGKLYVPGCDATESWDYGNYYMLDKGIWQKIRTIPHAVHVFDITCYKGHLYMATWDNSSNKCGVVSVNAKGIWSYHSPQERIPINPVHTLFEFKNKLYGVGEICFPIPYTCNLLVMDGTSTNFQKVSKAGLMPDASPLYTYTISKPAEFNGQLVYLGAKQIGYTYNWVPDALYVAPDLDDARQISFPESNIQPVDILIRDKMIYVLTNKKQSETEYINIVYQSDDLKNWNELFKFNTHQAFARSFEELNGDFFFGLGCALNSTPESSGNILLIHSNSY